MMWNTIGNGDSALIIVGAGYPSGVLGENAPPSTTNILSEVRNKHSQNYPILNEIISKRLNQNLNLNHLWSNTRQYAESFSYAFNNIVGQYKILDDSKINKPTMLQFIKTRLNYGWSPIQILDAGIGLEIKKFISYLYKPNDDFKFKKNILEIINHEIPKCEKRYWLSLNYDLVLEQSLLEFRKLKIFNSTSTEIRYLNEEIVNNDLNNPKHDSEDIIIKPHGSINLCFETNLSKDLHDLKYLDPNNYLISFDHEDIGYFENEYGYIIEKRPPLVGYIPDYLKYEHNSLSLFSDISHDFLKAQLASVIFAMNEVDTIFIICYSMPKEDEWVWKRIEGIRKKDDKKIKICCKDSNFEIRKRFIDAGFKIDDVTIINNGEI
jgi:hypothetical protein